MTQVNLLPADVRNRQRVRRVTAAAVGGVAAVVVLLLVVYALQSARLGKVNSELAAQQSLNAGLRGKIATLQHFEDLKNDALAKQQLVDGLVAQQILWSDALRDISASTPSGLYFTQVDGTLNEAPSGQVVGSITFEGTAKSHRRAAEWLVRLERVKGWVNSWVSSSIKDSAEEGSTVTFSGSVDLTFDATSNGRPR